MPLETQSATSGPAGVHGGAGVFSLSDFYTSFDPLSLNPILAFEASRSMLTDSGGAAGNLDLVATLENRVSGGANATQTTSTKQPRAHVPVGGGHLYLPSVSGNSASVTFPSIGVSEDFVYTTQVHLLNSADFYLVSGASATHRFAVFNGYFYMGTQFILLDSSLSTGDSTLTVERSGATITLKQDGVTRASKNVANSFDFTHLSFNQQFTSSIPGLNGYIKTATLSVAGTEELNIDFSNGAHGASSFVCSTGQTVSINKAGKDPASIVRREFLRFDGANTGLTGDFNSTNTTGGHLFVVYGVNGDGGESSGRVFVTNHSSNPNNAWADLKAFLWSLQHGQTGNIGYYHNQSFRGTHTLGFDPADGTLLHDIKVVDGQQISKVNNGDTQSTTIGLGSLASDEFSIGSSQHNLARSAIDLEALYLFDHTLTDDDATRVRDYLNAKSSIYRRITDSDALAYIAALEGDGVSVSHTQKEAIEDFYVTAKSGGWYSSLKRLYLPIWEAAAPNARCLVSSTSGTFEGSFTFAAGYSHPDTASNANRFDTGYKLLDGLTTENACLMALAYDNTPPTASSGINAANKTIIGAGSVTASSVRINTVSSSLKPQAAWLGVNSGGEGILSSMTFGSHGVMLSNRKDGDTTFSRRTGSAYDEASTTGTLTGSYNNLFPITGFGSSSASSGSAAQSTDSNAGAFGISEGLNATNRSSYTDAVKTLWETCSGITL